MRFLDSNILAYAFYENTFRERCQELVRDGGTTNTLVLIEAYQVLRNITTLEHATQAIQSLFKSHLKIVSLDANLIFETLKRVSKYKKLKFIDLVHYTTALLHSCNEIASYDTDFEGLEIKRVT